MLAHRNALDAARAASEGAAPQAPGFWKDVVDLLARAGGAGLALDGDLAVTYAMPFTRGLTIAGGASEIIRTQIAERVLGLPRT